MTMLGSYYKFFMPGNLLTWGLITGGTVVENPHTYY
jgi:hypothetical protein